MLFLNVLMASFDFYLEIEQCNELDLEMPQRSLVEMETTRIENTIVDIATSEVAGSMRTLRGKTKIRKRQSILDSGANLSMVSVVDLPAHDHIEETELFDGNLVRLTSQKFSLAGGQRARNFSVGHRVPTSGQSPMIAQQTAPRLKASTNEQLIEMHKE